MLFDKNGKQITNHGNIRFPETGLTVPVLYGEDDNLWVIIDGRYLPLTIWDTTKLEFIENPF